MQGSAGKQDDWEPRMNAWSSGDVSSQQQQQQQTFISVVVLSRDCNIFTACIISLCQHLWYLHNKINFSLYIFLLRNEKAITGMEDNLAWISFTNSVCILHFFLTMWCLISFSIKVCQRISSIILFSLLTFALSFCLLTMITCPRSDPTMWINQESFKEVKFKLVCFDIC